MLITGASLGIGAATAVLASARGWDVAISYHHSARPQKLPRSSVEPLASERQLISAR